MVTIKALCNKAELHHNKLKHACDKIALIAQQYLDWTDIDTISCDYYPSDGICICIDTNKHPTPMVIPVDSFFDAVRKSDNGMLRYTDLRLIAV